MNDHLLGDILPQQPFAFDITALMKARNCVTIEVGSTDPLGEITLEIRTQ